MNGNNPLFNMFGNQMMNNMPGPMGNMMQMINQFNKFRQSYHGSPIDAQKQVQQMLDSGQINQNQLNQAMNIARNMMNMMGQ